ncbi:kinase-like protein [Lentinus tigrinus ALCF2SS1-6]|uniref:Kinase-like protein n=2 Tax=Lentinus tigrinus TaxID=5365 RepID=A0A5C2RW40_9APHY|nr:kinase-like protein [Lentinus tigrinus ALCF2SS1-6]
MSRTTDRPNVLLDSSNYPTISSFLSLAPNVAGPSGGSSSSSSSSYLPQLLKTNAVGRPMVRPATKTGPLPMHTCEYVAPANSITQLPYAIYPVEGRTATPAYHASSWALPQTAAILPRGGAPARPVQRLHSNRMQPFPSRLKASAVLSEKQGRRRDGGVSHFHTAPHHPGLMPTPPCPIGVPPIPGKGPPVLQNGRTPLLIVPTRPTYFVFPQLPVIDPFSFYLPQPPLLTAPHVTYLQHGGVTFTVSHLLGEGSAGRVVLGENASRLYAIKVIHPRRARKTHSHRSNFIRERAFMITVGSSDRTRNFFVPLLMSWEEDGYGNQGRMFFVMPLHPMDMHAALSTRQPMSLKDRYLYCQELICALCALRQLGIIHKDIKPGNILINAQGRAVLSDFGLAQAVPDGEYDTWTGTFCAGTYAYMAPEMVRDVGWGSGVDVWSAGLAFLQILGFIPKRYFLSESLDAIRAEHKAGLPIHFDVPANFDVAFATIVQNMLHVNPLERMTVRQLDSMYASSSSWAKVRNATATHDWIPTIQSSRMRPVGQSLDFLTFRACEPSALAGANAPGAGELWRADTNQFEYRVSGEFE